MDRLYLYNGALAVLGFSFLLNATASFVNGASSVVLILFAVSGAGLVFGAGYESVRRDPAEFRISRGLLVALVVAACVSLLGTVVDVVGTA